MTQVATTTSDAGLRSGIARVIGRQRGLLRLIRLLQGTRGVLGMLLGFLLLDALWPMAAFVRVAVSIGVVVVVVLATMRLRLARTDSRDSFRVARKLEQWFGISSNALINALWFEKSDLTGVLAERSIEQGCREFHELDTNDTLDRRGLRGQTLKLAVIALTWVAVWMIQPRLIGGGLLRFANPFGDHPPFSLTVFDIRVSPDAIKSGDDATVNVALSGKLVDELNMVQVNTHGEEDARWPMRPIDGSRFDRNLRSLREPFTFYVEAATGRSHKFTIMPQQPEPVVHQSDGKSQDDPPVENGSTGAGQGGTDASSATSQQMREGLSNLRMLADAARLLRQAARQQAGAIGTSSEDTPMPQWQKKRLDELKNQVDRFNQRGASTAQQLRDLAKALAKTGAPADTIAALNEIADLLDQLKLTHFTKGEGAKGAGDNFRAASQWLDEIERAAKRDSDLLESLRLRLNEATGGMVTTGTAVPGKGGTPDTGGTHQEQNPVVKSNVDLPDAVKRGVPPEYLDLVGRYYERLNKDSK